jgi:hypothetical protein
MIRRKLKVHAMISQQLMHLQPHNLFWTVSAADDNLGHLEILASRTKLSFSKDDASASLGK